MVTIAGTLTVREIRGRNGPFVVGRLVSELGEFAIKNSLIEEYEEGSYRGSFSVSRIYPASYVAGGRVTCEVRADLVEIVLDDIAGLPPQEEISPEKDPLEEETAIATPAASAQQVDRENTDATTEIHESDTAEKLFGLLWPLGPIVKLDPTVGRATLREQTQYLKSQHYRYKPQETHWVLSTAA